MSTKASDMILRLNPCLSPILESYIFAYAGLKDLKSVSAQTSLTELGMDSMMVVEIKQTLEREFEVFLTAQDIRGLNFAKLQEMSPKSGETDKKLSSKAADSGELTTGIKLLVRLVGNEDLNPEICLKLNTKGEADQGQLFLVPGIEGVGSVFNDLARKLKAPAYCLQLGTNDNTQDSIDSMADKLLPVSCNFCLYFLQFKNPIRTRALISPFLVCRVLFERFD